jgi:very-short-patch-repair endonuclease
MTMKNDFPRIHVPPEIRRKMLEIAREFRKVPTKGEKILWESLRGRKLDGIKFRRQQPVGYFVVDFYNSVYRLVVEVDGPVHDFQQGADKARQEILEELGLIVLRINSEIVEKNLSVALTLIRDAIRTIGQNKRQDIPSSLMGEVKGGG